MRHRALALLAACSLLVACFSDDDVDACTRGRALTAKVHVVLLSNTMLPFGPSRARNFRDATLCTWARCVSDLVLAVRKPVQPSGKPPKLLALPGDT